MQSALPSNFTPLVRGHQGPIYTVKFNSDGEYCMTGSQDRSVCLYNPAKNLLIKNYKNIHNYTSIRWTSARTTPSSLLGVVTKT